MRNAGAIAGIGTGGEPQFTTLLSLVQSLQGEGLGADEVVETAAFLVNSGRVVLTGNFKGCRLELDAAT